jgi:hypothetical protein
MSSGESSTPAREASLMQALSARVEVAEKAQQEPQVSWERTRPTQADFCWRQSKEAGRDA